MTRMTRSLASLLAGWIAVACAAGPEAPAGAGADQAASRVRPRAEDARETGALPPVTAVQLQPLRAQIGRLLEALDYLGAPLLDPDERARLAEALESGDESAEELQALLDRHCLFDVHVNPESRVHVTRGPAAPELAQAGWRTFLVKVRNEAGVTARLRAESPNALPVFEQSGDAEVPRTISDADIAERWLDLDTFDGPPLTESLSGLSLEYRIIELFSRDAGAREASIGFDVGQGSQDIGFRNAVPVLFDAVPSVRVTLRVLDDDGRPTTARFLFRDALGRVYPAPSKRLAPDFFFHPQVYRADGETILLPAGTYTVTATRGPEYVEETRTVTVPAASGDASAPVETFRLERWIHPAELGWRSGDHHVHAAGCAHYADPSQGVRPEDMLRHVVGEGLDVGCMLSWGPCWYYQKQFFSGGVSELSTTDHLMRYDVEVSGFPSDYAGHLCLLGLTEDDYPGTTRIEEWPGWDLPILEWGRSQGAVVGFSHSGWGLDTETEELPNLEIPPFSGIGANEYIVDVTHDLVDFISAVDTPWPWELNIWYHTNNAGFRTKLSGETDFPCIYGERVGLGRSYVKVDGPLTWDRWLAGIDAGRSYVSEGRAHLIDFRVEPGGGEGAVEAGAAADDPGVRVGEHGSELRLRGPGPVTVRLTAAALLPEEPDPDLHGRPLAEKPYWHVERARIAGTRRVPVEVVVNGRPAARAEIEADGTLHELAFPIELTESSWVAVRIFAAAHTNPIYVLLDGRPIRSRESIQWCLDCVDQCWRSKSAAWRARFGGTRDDELADCREAYEHAREVYRARLGE